jgi:hypothetical protein
MFENLNVNNNNIKEFHITRGKYTKSEVQYEQIKNIFFKNSSFTEKQNNNFKILNEFKYIKIYFFICITFSKKH